MKKKILILLLIPTVLLITTACTSKKENEEEKKITKTIELVDSKLGFTTSFKYETKEKYSNIKEETGGASKAITFENEELDLSFEMYYNTMNKETYNASEKARSTQMYYKEYKFGDYEAYAYGEYDDKIYLNVLLGIEEDDTAEVLFVSIERLDNNSEIIVADVLEDERVQNLFNSMEFVKE